MYEIKILFSRGVVAILDLGERSMEGPKVPSEARISNSYTCFQLVPLSMTLNDI